MPWTETHIMDERVKFISEVLEGNYCMTELCRSYGISRKTGYKWLNRYLAEGPSALHDRSRAPHSHPQAISEKVKSSILSMKQKYPHWGPAKIRVKLQQQYSRWPKHPAVSTIGQFLKKQGLVCSRKRHRRASPTEKPLSGGLAANEVWTADFKGHFRTGEGSRCNPLTITDHYSRYLLCCRHLDRMDYKQVRMQFERIFREYGLPMVIRTDNGTPFSGRGLCGLSRLSIWWIRLGIHPERIEPGHPEQNGRHERFHRTLKDQTAKPPARTLCAQQKRFDSFVIEYNDDRPHEALNMRTPSFCYCASLRHFPSRLPQICYPEHMTVRRVYPHGDIRYNGRRLFVGESFSCEYIAVEDVSDEHSRLWYFDYELGILDKRRWRIQASVSRAILSGASPRKDGL